MNQDIKDYLQSRSVSLMDKISDLKMMDADDDLIKLLERAQSIGSITILHYEDLSMEAIDNVRSTLSLCDSLLKPENEANMNENFESLSRVVTSIEDLYRNKRLLLDGDKMII